MATLRGLALRMVKDGRVLGGPTMFSVPAEAFVVGLMPRSFSALCDSGFIQAGENIATPATLTTEGQAALDAEEGA